MIVAILEHPTQEKAAAALGISTVTLWRSMQKPESPKPIGRRAAKPSPIDRAITTGIQRCRGNPVASHDRPRGSGSKPGACGRRRAADRFPRNADRGNRSTGFGIDVRLEAVEESAKRT